MKGRGERGREGEGREGQDRGASMGIRLRTEGVREGHWGEGGMVKHRRRRQRRAGQDQHWTDTGKGGRTRALGRAIKKP